MKIKLMLVAAVVGVVLTLAASFGQTTKDSDVGSVAKHQLKVQLATMRAEEAHIKDIEKGIEESFQKMREFDKENPGWLKSQKVDKK